MDMTTLHILLVRGKKTNSSRGRSIGAIFPSLALLLWLLIFLSAAGCRREPEAAPTQTPNPSLSTCSLDSDCTLGLRIDQCCPCPIVTTQAIVMVDRNLVFYFFDTDYSQLLPAHCSEVVCEPCPPLPAGLFCDDGSCSRFEQP
jgi:hypothetical protein